MLTDAGHIREMPTQVPDAYQQRRSLSTISPQSFLEALKPHSIESAIPSTSNNDEGHLSALEI